MNQPMPADPRAMADLAELGRQIGIPDLCLDNTGCCQLNFDSRWLVTLLHTTVTRFWTVSCFLAVSGTAISADAQHAMLRANFMGGAGCAGGSLSISPDGRPCLQYRLAGDETSGRVLLATIENLLDQAEVWSERVQRNEMPPTSPNSPHHWIHGRV